MVLPLLHCHILYWKTILTIWKNKKARGGTSKIPVSKLFSELVNIWKAAYSLQPMALVNELKSFKCQHCLYFRVLYCLLFSIVISEWTQEFHVFNIVSILRDSSVDVFSVFFFTIIFCYHRKSLSIISSFLRIGKAIVSNWYLNGHLDDKLIKECVESVLRSFD